MCLTIDGCRAMKKSNQNHWFYFFSFHSFSWTILSEVLLELIVPWGNCINLSLSSLPLQTFVILPKEKTTVWFKQNVNFFQQNGSVIKIEQYQACSAKSPQVAKMNKNDFCSVCYKKCWACSVYIAYFSLLTISVKLGICFSHLIFHFWPFL
jgi:hypothetical protein